MQWWRNMGALVLCLAALPVSASLSPDLVDVRATWAHIKYELPKEKRADAFEKLAQTAHRVSQAHPGQAAPLVWEAIVKASLAGEKGAFGGALGYVKEARHLLEQAEKLPADGVRSSLYTTLGSLYYQVPGWPIGFGDDDKARQYLKMALALDPDGIDANYFYGDFLLNQDNYRGAATALERALAAPARPDRVVADVGRRREIEADLARARAKLGVASAD